MTPREEIEALLCGMACEGVAHWYVPFPRPESGELALSRPVHCPGCAQREALVEALRLAMDSQWPYGVWERVLARLKAEP